MIFKTSADATLNKLLYELGETDIECLIPSSQIAQYQKKYPYIHFIDICQEGFYDLPVKLIKAISEKSYDQVYVTFSGVRGHHYGNVMELVSKVHFKKAFFYNCNGDKTEISRHNVIKDRLCSAYIAFVSFMYELRRK